MEKWAKSPMDKRRRNKAYFKKGDKTSCLRKYKTNQ
jgi:hypothetical protein